MIKTGDVLAIVFLAMTLVTLLIGILNFIETASINKAENKIYENCKQHGVHIFPDSRIIKCEVK